MSNTASEAAFPPPQVQLLQMALGGTVAHIVRAAVELKLPDHLAAGPKTAAQVAQGITVHAPSLYRMMRTLASLGILTQDAEDRFGLTPLGDALREGAPGGGPSLFLTLTSDWWTRGMDQLRYSVETGKSGFEKVLHMPVFEFIAQAPERVSAFNGTMMAFHGEEPRAVVAAYDFSGLKTIVDVGGGMGNLLTTILAANPGVRGTLFDMPHVVRNAPALFQSRGVADRAAIAVGSFFESVPEGADAYLMSHVIHDWSEEKCVAILGNCRRAMRPESKLLLIEMVLPEGATPHPGKLLDLVMLVAPGGQERTVPEYEALLAKAGLRLTRVVPTMSPVSVVEAVRV
jgi:O-methyltransferase domain/Dimerisation domain